MGGVRPDVRVVPAATGRREIRDGLDWVVYLRRLRAPVDRVWSSLTDGAELAKWIGTYRQVAGDPAGHPAEDGRVREFLFTFEGDDLLPMTYRLEHVDPCRSFGVSMRDPGAESSWRVEVDLMVDGDHTVLRVAQAMLNAALAPSVAAGYEYYLDRLVALHEGRSTESFEYDEYFLGQAEHYRRMFPLQQRRRRP